LDTLADTTKGAIYVPHRGYTAPQGFDCFHAGDYAVWWPGRRNGVFRSSHFVYQELTRIVASLRRFLLRASPKTHTVTPEP
jgi:hypothetical protein